jgi:hypothetical protein
VATGYVFLAMNPARPVLTILLTAPAASTEEAISRPQLNLNLAYSHVLMAPMQAKESVWSAISDVQLAWDQLLTVSLARLIKFYTKEAAGANALLFRCNQWVKMLPVSISAPTVFINDQLPNVLHATSSALLVKGLPTIVPLACTDQSQ